MFSSHQCRVDHRTRNNSHRVCLDSQISHSGTMDRRDRMARCDKGHRMARQDHHSIGLWYDLLYITTNPVVDGRQLMFGFFAFSSKGSQVVDRHEDRDPIGIALQCIRVSSRTILVPDIRMHRCKVIPEAHRHNHKWVRHNRYRSKCHLRMRILKHNTNCE